MKTKLRKTVRIDFETENLEEIENLDLEYAEPKWRKIEAQGRPMNNKPLANGLNYWSGYVVYSENN